MHITNIEMWTDLSIHKGEALSKFSAVYIGGGNTYSLLHQLRMSSFDRHLINCVRRGGIIYGGSAGAAIMGADIRTISHLDDNHIGLMHTNGLNLVNDYAVWVHYQPQDDALIFEYCEKLNHPVLAISERAGVVIDNSQIFSAGYEPAFIFDQKSKSQLHEYTYQ